MKKRYLLLILPLLFQLTSCGNGKQIDANQAKQIYLAIEKYVNEECKVSDYTKVLTSHSEIFDDGVKNVYDIYNLIERKNNSVHSYYKNDKNGEKKVTEVYFYEKKGEYYQNENKIAKGLYEAALLSYGGSNLASNYLDFVDLYISACLKGTELGKTTFYSKGEGNLTVVQELNVKNNEETYYSKTTFKYDDYKFAYYEFESEQKETDGDVEKQHRTESLKYKASFINKYR